jgi:surface polysaccharide O-acyltransferase-like enzyme
VAYRSRWFVDPDRIPKSILVWLLLAAGSITCACITGWWVFGVDDVPLHHHVAFQGSMALTCVSLVVLTHMLVYRFWRSPGRFSDSLSENSFGIYLVQYPVILALQLPLISWNPFHGFKWVVVSIASLLVSWLLAEFFIRKMPRVGMALTVALFGVILIAT